MKKITSSLLVCLCSISAAPLAIAESKRIEVYELSQTYVDVREGDTLSEIVAELLPHNVAMQQKLMDDIINMNPDAFPQNSAQRMLSGKRLFLPNSLQQADSKPGNVEVESFSWGNIKRQR